MNDARCRAVISLARAEQNYLALRHVTKPSAGLMCVVKANAYGHGAARLACLWERLGACMFAVATAEEAFALRRAGVTLPILVFGYAPAWMAGDFHALHILPTVYSRTGAISWNHAAQAAGIRLSCHIKMDTGMTRLGMRKEDLDILPLPHLLPMGIYSHCYAADISPIDTKVQYNTFLDMAAHAEQICGHTLVKHIANTDALLRYPEMHLDMVRAGIGLYGYATCARVPLYPIMRVEARVVQVRHVAEGVHIGYGVEYISKRATHVATVAMGYADGLRRDSGMCGVTFRIRGRACPIIGQVCMDMCMVDTGDAPVRVGDTAVFIGDAGRTAEALGTIPYEVLTSLSARVARVYVSDFGKTDVFT